MCTRPLFRQRVQTSLGNEMLKWKIVPLQSVKHVKEANNVVLNHFRPDLVTQIIPCGQCLECRLEHAKSWAFRCMKEVKEHEDNIMMTLTYNDVNVPKGFKILNPQTSECGEQTLVLKHKDVQDFLKRLRKAIFPATFKYYMCGEYGTSENSTHRPHYHIIFFGYKPNDLVAYKTSDTEYGTHILYKSKTIDRIWGKGFVDLNEVNYETCAYVARYVMKKQKGHWSKEFYEFKGLVPEYTQMSKGIGKKYFEDNKEKFYEEEKIWQKTQKGLIKAKPGRYFDKLMEAENPDALKKIKENRKRRSEEIMRSILSQTTLDEDEYNLQKEFLTAKRVNKLKRSLK